MDIKPQNPTQPINPNPATPPAPQPSAMPASTPPAPTNIPVSTPTESTAPAMPSSMSAATPPAPQPNTMSAQPASAGVQPVAAPASTNIPVSNSDLTSQQSNDNVQPANVQQNNEPVQTTQNPNAMQSPTVFDTNQYHLPIEKQKKHNTGKQMLVFGVVFVIVIVIGGLLAVDAELINLGFDAPFDLIK